MQTFQYLPWQSVTRQNLSLLLFPVLQLRFFALSLTLVLRTSFENAG